MRRFVPIGLAGFACAVLVAAAPTQEEKKSQGGYGEAAEPKPAMFYVVHEYVRPSMMQEYEEATKSLVEAMHTTGVDSEKVNFFTIVGPEMGYTYVMKIKDFADMDRAHKDWESAIATIGEEKWKATAEKADKAVTHRATSFVMARHDLSYHPEKPRIAGEDVKYIHYGFYYPVPGQETALEDVAKEYRELYEAKRINSGWTVYQTLTGADLPLYIVSEPGRSKVDYFQNKERDEKLAGDEGEYLGMKAMGTLRRYEEKEAWVRPDLSFMPEEEMVGTGSDSPGRH